MITDVEIEDYQAVRRASLKLGRFTVVTGPTGSGKSAAVRALKLAAFNARGTSYVRHGAKSCKVLLQDDQGLLVGITRGGRGQDAYVVGVLGEKKTFTKLVGSVPEEIAGLLQLGDINFAGQFDRPFLLADSGSQVARTLGELTNVTLVFDAAREANRRRQEFARELKLQEKSLEGLVEQAQGFRTLKERRYAAHWAKLHLGEAEELSSRRRRLCELYDRWYQADLARADVDMYLDETEPVPTEKLDALQARLARLRNLYAQHREGERAERQWQNAAAVAVRDEEQAHRALHDTLVVAGVCPTCGQAVGE